MTTTMNEGAVVWPPRWRERQADKAARLLASGRVHVPDVERVIVDGDTGRHTVTFTDDRWGCDCDGYLYRRSCSHVSAVRLITTAPRR